MKAIDSDGHFVLPGDRIRFSFGIPPQVVEGPVVTIHDELWVLTPKFTPSRCKLKDLREYVGEFWKV